MHSDAPTISRDDSVYSHPCGCEVRCLESAGFKRYQSEYCLLHSGHTWPAAEFRMLILIQAKRQEKEKQARNVIQPIRRSFTEMSARGGFDI